MNKGFFVVFLGVILGAMALIFVNQTSGPAGGTGTYQVASGVVGNAAVNGAGDGPATTASNDVSVARQSTPDVSQTPTAPAPAPVKPETPRPEPVQPVAPPDPPKSEPAKPQISAPVAASPEPEKPDSVAPATPEPAAPSKPVAAQPGAQPGTTGMTPVTSIPETPSKPGAGQTKNSLTLVNIGLHFKGNGMALRIEADAPFFYKTFALPSPERYVVDLVGIWNNMRVPSVPSNNMIKSARVGKQSGGPRLVLDMQRSPKKHNVTWITPTVLEIVIE